MKRVFISFLAVLMLMSSVSAISFEFEIDITSYGYRPFYGGNYASGYCKDGFFIVGPEGTPIIQPGLYLPPDVSPLHFPYCDDLFILQTNTKRKEVSKYGIVDGNGNIKVPFQYDCLTFINHDYAWIGLVEDAPIDDPNGVIPKDLFKTHNVDGVVRISDGKEILRTQDQTIDFSVDHKYFILTHRTTGKIIVCDLEGNVVPNMTPPEKEKVAYYLKGKECMQPTDISLPPHLKARSDEMVKCDDDYLIEVENDDGLQGIYSKNKGLILDTNYYEAYIIAQGRAIVATKADKFTLQGALYDSVGNEIIPFGQYAGITGVIECNYILVSKKDQPRHSRFSYVLLKQGNMKPQPITKADAWAQDELKTAIDAGILPENMQHSYQGYINRQYFCRLVMQIYNKAVDNGLVDNTGFSDVKAFKDTEDIDVQHAAALGIVNGYGDGIFKPKELIKRSDAAVMLYRLAKVINPDAVTDEPLDFTDEESINEYARDAVAYISSAVDNKTNRRVMQGVSGNRFDPNGTYTRQQAYLSAIRLFHFVSQK